LQQAVVLAFFRALLDLPAHRLAGQRVRALRVSGGLDVERAHELLPLLLQLGHRGVDLWKLVRLEAALVGAERSLRAPAIDARLVVADVALRDPLLQALGARIAPRAPRLCLGRRRR